MRIQTLNLFASDSPETNDHQLRPSIDGRDLLGNDHLGLDPPEFFRQPALRSHGELLIGRCECGVIGCDDRAVTVERDVNSVCWRLGSGHDLQFAVTDYDAELERAANDFSWESVGRHAERLVNAGLLGAVTSDGYRFRWSSTRIRPDTITLCFDRNGDQRLTDVEWNGKADHGVVATVRRSIP